MKNGFPVDFERFLGHELISLLGFGEVPVWQYSSIENVDFLMLSQKYQTTSSRCTLWYPNKPKMTRNTQSGLQFWYELSVFMMGE